MQGQVKANYHQSSLFSKKACGVIISQLQLEGRKIPQQSRQKFWFCILGQAQTQSSILKQSDRKEEEEKSKTRRQPVSIHTVKVCKFHDKPEPTSQPTSRTLVHWRCTILSCPFQQSKHHVHITVSSVHLHAYIADITFEKEHLKQGQISYLYRSQISSFHFSVSQNFSLLHFLCCLPSCN